MKPNVGATRLMSNVNVALVLVLSACTFEVYGDDNCLKKTKTYQTLVLLVFLLRGTTRESCYYLIKKEFLLLIYSTFSRRSHLEAGLWRLCVSPSWRSALGE